MTGQSDLTPAMDVYAFAICCVEILTNGALPWPHSDDDTVRHLVLSKSFLFSFSFSLPTSLFLIFPLHLQLTLHLFSLSRFPFPPPHR